MLACATDAQTKYGSFSGTTTVTFTTMNVTVIETNDCRSESYRLRHFYSIVSCHNLQPAANGADVSISCC